MKKQTKVKNWKQQQLISSIVEKTEPQCSCSRSYCCCQNVLAFQQYISIFLTRWFIQWVFFGVFHFVLFLLFFFNESKYFYYLHLAAKASVFIFSGFLQQSPSNNPDMYDIIHHLFLVQHKRDFCSAKTQRYQPLLFCSEPKAAIQMRFIPSL